MNYYPRCSFNINTTLRMVGFTLTPSNQVFNLPIDLVYIITDHICDYKNIIQLSQVNRGLHEALWKEPRFWQRLWKRNISANIPEESEGEIRSKYLSVFQRLNKRKDPYQKLGLAVKEGWECVFNCLFRPKDFSISSLIIPTIPRLPMISGVPRLSAGIFTIPGEYPVARIALRPMSSHSYERNIPGRNRNQYLALASKDIGDALVSAEDDDDPFIIEEDINAVCESDSDDESNESNESDDTVQPHQENRINDNDIDDDRAFANNPMANLDIEICKLLILAIHYGRIPIVESLLNSGVPMDGRYYDALIVAIRSGRLDVMNYLMTRDNHYNEHALCEATRCGYLDIFDRLLESETDIPELGDVLVSASVYGHAKIVERLVKLVSTTYVYDYALNRAVDYGRHDVVVALITARPDIIGNNNDLLITAIQERFVKIVDLLLRSGASPQVQDNEALIQSIEYLHEPCGDRYIGRNMKLRCLVIIRLLLKHGANVNARNSQALRIAVENGSYEVIPILLKAGAIVCDDIYDMACKNERIRGIIDAHR